eukprot:Selendium_serpulae@DN5332_c0_g1_i1.p2
MADNPEDAAKPEPTAAEEKKPDAAQFDFGEKRKKKKDKTKTAKDEDEKTADGATKEKKEKKEKADKTEKAKDKGDAAKFDFGEKRKKKDKVVKPEGTVTVAAATPLAVAAQQVEKGPLYEYSELLERVKRDIAIHFPKLEASKRYLVKPPQVVRCGTKKIVWVNFEEVCKVLKRDTDHVFQFVLAELAIDGSIAGNGQLVLKGRFVQKDIEKLLRKYIKEYVRCRMCKSPETSLERDPRTRLHTISCSACKSNRSVSTIKSGFHATLKGERKRLKEKAQ